MAPPDASQIKKRGWRQGSILPSALVEQLALPADKKVAGPLEQLVVVLSQCCDVTNGDFEKEPLVEFLFGQTADPDPNLYHAKNSRLLQLERESSKAIQFNIHDRILAPRQVLASVDPEGRLSEQEVRVLSRWVARRYIRPAFPDNFNKRVSKLEKKLHQLLKSAGSSLLGIWIDVCDDELPANQDYEILVFIVMKSEAFDDSVGSAASAIKAKIQDHIEACPGICLLGNVQLRSSTTFSLDDDMNTKRWDFDDLSLRDEDDILPAS